MFILFFILKTLYIVFFSLFKTLFFIIQSIIKNALKTKNKTNAFYKWLKQIFLQE